MDPGNEMVPGTDWLHRDCSATTDAPAQWKWIFGIMLSCVISFGTATALILMKSAHLENDRRAEGESNCNCLGMIPTNGRWLLGLVDPVSAVNIILAVGLAVSFLGEAMGVV